MGSTEPTRGRILVIDDDPQICRTMRRRLAALSLEVAEANRGRDALQMAQEQDFDVALVDLRLPDMSGLDVIRALRELAPATQAVMVTGTGNAHAATEALGSGAVDYITKPILDWSRISTVIARCLEVRSLRREVEPRDAPLSGEFLGRSQAVQKLMRLVARVAPSPVPVVITGESGTGKERVARAIHGHSGRSGPWIALNCSAVAPDLMESELFGYDRGSHSTATTPRAGFFEAAHGGTLLLDEVGEMPLRMQSKLLRVLQEGEVLRVGATRPRGVDTRVIAATHVDLAKAVADGTFREDLYHRLRVIELRVPPLRERTEDIPLLTWHFVHRYNRVLRRDVRRIEPGVMDLLCGFGWRANNVRELENAIQRAMVLCTGDTLVSDLFELGPTDLPAPRGAFDAWLALPYTQAKDAVVQAFSQAYLEGHLEVSAGNVAEAARASGLQRQNFRRLMKRHGVDRSESEAPEEHS